MFLSNKRFAFKNENDSFLSQSNDLCDILCHLLPFTISLSSLSISLYWDNFCWQKNTYLETVLLGSLAVFP